MILDIFATDYLSKTEVYSELCQTSKTGVLRKWLTAKNRSVNPTKWSNTLKSVFDHFVNWCLKG